MTSAAAAAPVAACSAASSARSRSNASNNSWGGKRNKQTRSYKGGILRQKYYDQTPQTPPGEEKENTNALVYSGLREKRYDGIGKKCAPLNSTTSIGRPASADIETLKNPKSPKNTKSPLEHPDPKTLKP
eukprot:1194507-Prorocentrum_minimum.AAC.6